MQDIITILPNLSIGVISVMSLVWYADKTQKRMQDIQNNHICEFTKMHERHMQELNDREKSVREIETEVRLSIITQLTKNTELMQRIIIKLDK